MNFLVDKKGYLMKPDKSYDSKIKLPDNTKIVCDYAFYEWGSLKEVSLPSGLLTIGENAFAHCLNLETINLPETLYNLENSAFADCVSLQYIKLPDNIDYVREMCFLNCKSLKGIRLSPNTTSICDFAFKNCDKLESIELPKTLKRLGLFSFYNCSSLKEVKLPLNLQIIGDYAFSYCHSLMKIEIPDEVEDITDGAFLECTNLKEITFGKKVKKIAEEAFSQCSNIELIKMYNYNNLTQPGLKNCLNNINYAYLDSKTEQLVLSKNKLNRKDLKPIDYEYIQELIGCSKESAIILTMQYGNDYQLDKLRAIEKALPFIMMNPNYSKVLNDYKKYSKEFLGLCKKLSIETYVNNKLFLSDNYIEVYELFKLAYNLGVFSKNQVERQRGAEFIANIFAKNYLNFYSIQSITKDMKLGGYNEEWAKFVMNKANTESLLKIRKDKKTYLAQSYNEFANIKEFNRSNKGSQHYLKICLEACDKYFSSDSFLRVDASTQDIANELRKFTRNQSTFDEAKAIREEYLYLKRNDLINDHILGEELNEISELKAKIYKNINETLDNISSIINEEFTYEFLSKYDALNFVLGKYCSCCAHLEGVGFGITRGSIIRDDCQNLVIKDKNGKVVAKSTIYINRNEGYGLFNTIEIDEKITTAQKNIIYQKYIKAINIFASKYNEKNPKKPLKQINVGTHSNDLIVQLNKNKHKDAESIIKGIDFSIYGKPGSYHEGDWKQGQKVLWEASKMTIK